MPQHDSLKYGPEKEEDGRGISVHQWGRLYWNERGLRLLLTFCDYFRPSDQSLKTLSDASLKALRLSKISGAER